MFYRKNIFDVPLVPEVAHGGEGEIMTRRIAHSDDVDSRCNFIDYTEMPPGTSIGLHTHNVSEEEFYLIVSGSGDCLLYTSPSPRD